MDYTAHLSHLESQLVIADAHFAEEKARLVAELEGLYGEIDGLRTGVRNGESEGRGNGVVLSARASQDKERMGSSRPPKRQESAVGDDRTVHRSTLDALRRQCDELEKTHTQDLAQIVELRAAVTNLQHATGLAQRNNEIIAQEKQELEEAHRELEVTAQTLQEDIGRLRAQNAELKSDQANLTVDHEILTGEHQDLSDEVVGLRADRRSLRQKVVAEEEKVADAQRERVTAEDRLKERESAVQGLETQLVEQEQGNALLRIRIADLERTATEFNALQEKHDNLREHTDAIEAAHVSLLTRSTTLERTVESLTERTAAAEHATLSTKFDALTVTLERDSLAEAQQTAQAELAALQDRISGMEQDKMRDDAVRNELQEELVDIGHENTRLVGENEELMGVRQERDALGLRVSELKKAVGSAQEEVASGVKEKEAIEGSLKTTQTELEKLRKQISAQKDSLARATSTETTLLERQADLKALQKTTDALRHENKTLSTTLAKMKAEQEASKKELVPLRLERDRLRNDGKKVESERNLLRHQVETLRRQGAGAPQGDVTDQVASLRATHAAALAAQESAHQASQQEIVRLHEEREEFKKYCEWVRPDRERLKEELKALRAAFDESEREKKTLMEEVTRYLQQQQQSPEKPVATPVVPASPAPAPNAQLVEQLRIIDQEFTKYRARVEAELAEGKSELAQVEMEKSMVEEELARVRDAQARPKAPPLSSEIHAIIAGFLAGDNAFRSLANLGAISRDLRQATLPILYETLVLDDNGDEDWAYGTRVDVQTGLVLPSGWAYVKHLFLSNKHHDRIKTIIWAAQKPTETFLDVAFPQLKFHMTYYMHDGSDKPDHPPEWKRVCKLAIHRPVDTTVFHGLLTTLSLRCYLVRGLQVAANGKPNGSVDAKPFHNGIKPQVMEQADPACTKLQVPELTRLGVVNGITEIHFLPRGRLVNRSRSEPCRRYVHQLDTDLSLRLDFTRDDSALQATLYELSLLFKRPPGMPLKDTKMHLRCPDVSTQVYHALILAICRVVPNAIHNMHIAIFLSPKETLSFPRFEDIFSVAVRLFSDLWLRIPSRRRDDHARDSLPLFHLVGFTHDDVRVDGTIRPRAGSRGTAFVADVQAKDRHGVNVYRSDSYPAMYPKS